MCVHKISIYIRPEAANITCFFNIAKRDELSFVSGEKTGISPNTIEELRFKKELDGNPIHYCIDENNILIDNNSNAKYLLSMVYTKNSAQTLRFKAELKNGNSNYTPKFYGYSITMG